MTLATPTIILQMICYIISQALGGTLLALGIYLKIEFRSLNDISDDNFSLWTYVLIGTAKADNFTLK